MQLDLQSVENVPFQYVRMSFGPEKVGNWSCSPQDEPELSPRSIHRFSHFSGGALAVKHRQQFFDPTGSNTITIVHRIDKNDLSRAVSRFSGGPDDFFDLIGDCYRILTQLDKKRVDGDFLQLGPWRSTKQFWIHLEENSDSFLLSLIHI